MNNNLLHLEKSGAQSRAKPPAGRQKAAHQSLTSAVVCRFDGRPPEAQNETAQLTDSDPFAGKACLICRVFDWIDRAAGLAAPWIITLAALYLLAQIVRALLN